jgi:hypothetical protein
MFHGTSPWHGVAPSGVAWRFQNWRGVALSKKLYSSREDAAMDGTASSLHRLVSILVVFAGLNIGCWTAVAGQTSSAEARHFDLHIKDGRITEALKTVQVQRGDTVEIVWSADQENRIHVHGYDLDLALPSQKSVVMKFVVNATGRFSIHDNRHRLLIYLEVLPR